MSGKRAFVVTVKLPKNSAHDPRHKITGSCPYSPVCTDVTGEHHSYLETAFESLEEITAHLQTQGVHVTRIEAV